MNYHNKEDNLMEKNVNTVETFVEELSEEELAMVSGGKKGPGWVRTITDDCPNSVFVCC